jgi:hypothetical protein
MKMGDIPVPLVLTRDQIRLIRGALFVINDSCFNWTVDIVKDIAEVVELIDHAEDRATINNAKLVKPTLWQEIIDSLA